MATVAAQQPVMEESQHTADRPADLPRPYKCPLCTKAFHRLEHQTRHIRTHTGEKPHACQFPGCSKRFSRSDELTRHSRIHNNPNGRRNNKAHQAYAQAPLGAVPAYVSQDGVTMMPPPLSQVSRSAPQSQLSSPNVSPPHSYAFAQAPYPGAINPVASPSSMMPATTATANNPMSISLLATAASKVEYDAAMQSNVPAAARHHMQGHSHLQYHYPSRHSSTSLSAYALSNSHSSNSTAANSPLHSRAHSPTRHFETPLSTAPSSPTWSHNSISPTPDHTPLATPAHSPRLRPYAMPSHPPTSHSSSASLSTLGDYQQHGNSGVHLPSLRQLSLNPGLTPSPPSSVLGPTMQQSPSYGMSAPLLAPMEPSVNTSAAYLSPAGSGSNTPFGSLGNGGHLTDIMSRTRGEERKLPVPRVASGDMQSFGMKVSDAMEL